MLFGDISRFGIEFVLSPNPEGKWMFGHLCYWLCGQRIGDYESITSLRDAMSEFETISREAGKRCSQHLFMLGKEELADMLERSMFGDQPVNELLETRATEEQWARFIIAPTMEVFIGWHIFLIEESHSGRAIYHNHASNKYFECNLQYGEFDQVLNMAVQSLRQHCSAISLP